MSTLKKYKPYICGGQFDDHVNGYTESYFWFAEHKLGVEFSVYRVYQFMKFYSQYQDLTDPTAFINWLIVDVGVEQLRNNGCVDTEINHFTSWLEFIEISWEDLISHVEFIKEFDRDEFSDFDMKCMSVIVREKPTYEIMPYCHTFQGQTAIVLEKSHGDVHIVRVGRDILEPMFYTVKEFEFNPNPYYHLLVVYTGLHPAIKVQPHDVVSVTYKRNI
jgi:hypothetical protein